MKGVIPAHLQGRFDYLNSLTPNEPPHPWRKLPAVHAGGLEHVGFGKQGDLLLLVSTAGRGVVNCLTGENLARDYTDYFPDSGTLEAEGIGPLDGCSVRVAGIFGSGLSCYTNDGWNIERHPLSWPDDELILCPPGHSMLWQPPNAATKATKLLPLISSLVAFGFSPTGKSLVIASSSDVTIYYRE